MRQDTPVQPLPNPIPSRATDQILGVPLGLIDYERTLEWIDAMVAEREQGYVCVCNVHTRDGLAGGPRASVGAARRLAQRARRPAARVGPERARSFALRSRVRPRADGSCVRAGRVERPAFLPVRWPQPGSARAARAQSSPALPRGSDRRRLLATASAPSPQRSRPRSSPRSTMRGRRRVGRHRRPEAGEVDGESCARILEAPRADRRRRGLRLPCRAGAAGSALAAARRARMGLPSRPRTAPTVAAVPAVQPAVRGRVRAPARRAPQQTARSPETTTGRGYPAATSKSCSAMPCRMIMLAKRSPTVTSNGRSDGATDSRGGCSTWAAAPAARSTSFAPAIRTSNGWASTFRARRRRGSGREPTRGSRPSTGCRCRSPTAPSTRVLQAGARARAPSGAAARRGPPGARPRRVVRRLDLPARDLSLAEHVELHARWDGRAPRASRVTRGRAAPGIDGFTLIAWRLAGFHRCFHRWWGRESPFNRALNACGRRASGGRPDAQHNETAVLRTVRVPRPARRCIDVIGSEYARAAPHDPENLLDRMSRPSTLGINYRQIMRREQLLLGRTARHRGW